MSKTTMIARIAAKTGMTKQASAEMLEHFHASLLEEILENQEYRIRGALTISVVTRKSRPGRNPRTGELVVIPEGRVLKVKTLPEFRDKL